MIDITGFGLQCWEGILPLRNSLICSMAEYEGEMKNKVFSLQYMYKDL